MDPLWNETRKVGGKLFFQCFTIIFLFQVTQIGDSAGAPKLDVYITRADLQFLKRLDYQATLTSIDGVDTYVMESLAKIPRSKSNITYLYMLATGDTISPVLYIMTRQSDQTPIRLQKHGEKPNMRGPFLNVYSPGGKTLLWKFGQAKIDDATQVKREGTYIFYYCAKPGQVEYTLSPNLEDVHFEELDTLEFVEEVQGSKDPVAIFKSRDFVQNLLLHEHYSDGSLRYLGREYKVIGTEKFLSGRCKFVGLDLNGSLDVLGMHSIRITRQDLENKQNRETAHFVFEKDKETSDGIYDVYLKPISKLPPPPIPKLSDGQALFTVRNSSERILEWSTAIAWETENLTMGEFTFKLVNTSLGSALSKHVLAATQNGKNSELVILYLQNGTDGMKFSRLEVEYDNYDPQSDTFSVKHKDTKDEMESNKTLKPTKSDQKYVLHKICDKGELQFMGSNLNTNVSGRFPDKVSCIIGGLDKWSWFGVFLTNMIRISSESEPVPAFVEPNAYAETSAGVWDVHFRSPKQCFKPKISSLTESQRRLIITNIQNDLIWFIPVVEWKKVRTDDRKVLYDCFTLVNKKVESELIASLADKYGKQVKGITLIAYGGPGERAVKATFDLKEGHEFRIKITETIEKYEGINLY